VLVSAQDILIQEVVVSGPETSGLLVKVFMSGIKIKAIAIQHITQGNVM
jgi:predicted peptidase